MDRATHSPPPFDVNTVDVDYAEQTYADLHVAMAASRAASAGSSRSDVRALAREALAQQTTELVAITACLRDWARPPALGPHPDAPALRGLEGVPLDEAFTAQLVAHAHASKAAARVQAERGASRRVRDLAQHSIRTQSLLLSAVARLARSAAGR